ncbi:MAG: hypothetical protein GEV08_03990 [Acidimicrobiia bacterium]|nr:hypothetical protein [Acidimicrobiia bacterium]
MERLDTGPIRLGSTAKVKQPGQRAKVWTVTAVEPDRRFAWTARVFGTDMTGTHTLAASDTGTSNTLNVDIAGRGSWFVGRRLGGQIRSSLPKENAGFKRVAEAPEVSAVGGRGAPTAPGRRSARRRASR